MTRIKQFTKRNLEIIAVVAWFAFIIALAFYLA